MKTIKFFILIGVTTLPLNSFAYDSENILCGVNRSRETPLSCRGKWVKMKNYPEVELRRKSCNNFKSTETLFVRINKKVTTHKNVTFPFELDNGQYKIDCISF